MSNQIKLQKAYIKVQREKTGEVTYGGDQGFFREEKPLCKYQSGCGVVAFLDLLLYLTDTDREVSEKVYKDYFNQIYSLIGGIPFMSGISGLKLQFKFNWIARQRHWKVRAKWGLSGKKLFSRVKEMLQKDIPVILCIPHMIRKKDKKDKLAFYKKETFEKVQETSSHYVMITGIVQKEKEIYFSISSWGKEYYINWKEYDTYMNTHFLGKILGNILYIR